MSDSYYFLGRTADKRLIFAGVEIRPAEDREVTFTDHSTGPRPEEVGIYFLAYRDVPSARGVEATMISDRWEEGGGQIPAEDRVLIGDVSEHVRAVEAAWASEHLNTLNAACEHMTEEMLNPSDAVLDEYIADNEDRGRYGRTSALQSWRIENVVCPVTGYQYGHKWLARTPDPEVVQKLRDAIAVLPKVAPR